MLVVCGSLKLLAMGPQPEVHDVSFRPIGTIEACSDEITGGSIFNNHLWNLFIQAPWSIYRQCRDECPEVPLNECYTLDSDGKQVPYESGQAFNGVICQELTEEEEGHEEREQFRRCLDECHSDYTETLQQMCKDYLRREQERRDTPVG